MNFLNPNLSNNSQYASSRFEVSTGRTMMCSRTAATATELMASPQWRDKQADAIKILRGDKIVFAFVFVCVCMSVWTNEVAG
jgi:hypothetical protein